MKRLISVFTALIMLICSFSFAVSAEDKTVQLGSYPQSRVTDGETLEKLNGLSVKWLSYGYFSGNGSKGSAKSGDFMKYADVTLGGEKYRAVKIDDYRPLYTHKKSSSKTYQKMNGYLKGNVYWFKYEPLKWKVLGGSGILMCVNIIDSQPFNNAVFKIGGAYYNSASGTAYAHDYAESTIRKWLNNDFYSTAFTESEKAKLEEYACEMQYYPRNKPHGEMTVNDKVFMLSRIEATDKSLGFKSSMYSADPARRAKGTDYAQSQGLHVLEFSFLPNHYGNSCWWLRAPAFYSRRVNKIFYDGYCAVDSYYMVELTDIGVRPCIYVK